MNMMYDRDARSRIFSNGDFHDGCQHNRVEFEAKKHKVPSVEKIVRSLSDRYVAAVSPFTCKKKTMSTTTVTSLLSLEPVRHAPCKAMVQSTGKKGTNPDGTTATNLQVTAAETLSKRVTDKEIFPCVQDSCPSQSDSAIRSQSEEVESKRTPLRDINLFTSLHLQNISGVSGLLASSEDQNNGVDSPKTLLLESKMPRCRHTCHSLEVLPSDCKANPIKKRERLGTLLKHKDDELDGIQTAGFMLRELCMKQEYEIKKLKELIPVTLKEVRELSAICQKQEKELAQSRSAIPVLQARVDALTEQLSCLEEELRQMRAVKEIPQGEVSSHCHEREASNCSSSCLTIETSPLSGGFLERSLRSKAGKGTPAPHETRPSPVSACESGDDRCSRDLSVERHSGPITIAEHKKIFNAVPSADQILKGIGRKSSIRAYADKDIANRLQELDNAAERERSLLQEKHGSAAKESRSSSFRLSNIEPIKSILTCGSPQPLEEYKLNKRQVDRHPTANTWSLEPT